MTKVVAKVLAFCFVVVVVVSFNDLLTLGSAVQGIGVFRHSCKWYCTRGDQGGVFLGVGVSPELQTYVPCVFVQTNFSRSLWEGGDAPKAEENPDFALGPMGKPEDCAGAVAFLCSSDARFISGETLMMTGQINSRL
jgi:hypothetical protein